MKIKEKNNTNKTPATNVQFGVRRGVSRGTLYMYFGGSPPVRPFLELRPTAKLLPRYLQAADIQWYNDSETRKTRIKK